MERYAQNPYEWIVPSDSREDTNHYVTIDRAAVREFTELDLPGFCTCESFLSIYGKIKAGQFVLIKSCHHIRYVRLYVLGLALTFLYYAEQAKNPKAAS